MAILDVTTLKALLVVVGSKSRKMNYMKIKISPNLVGATKANLQFEIERHL